MQVNLSIHSHKAQVILRKLKSISQAILTLCMQLHVGKRIHDIPVLFFTVAPYCITYGLQLNGTSLHYFHVLLRHQQYEVVVAEGQHGKCSIAPIGITTQVSNPHGVQGLGFILALLQT